MNNLDPDVTHTPLAVPVQVMPSQQKLLEQLHYLTTFHNSLVILAGPEGAGKTTLLEVFLEQASDYANLAYLCATPQLTIEQVRQRLFQQIGTLSRIQPNASLSKTIRRALPDEPQHLMVVVDDADLLTADIVQELQDLVLHSRFTGGKHRISVVVSGTPEWAARQRAELTTSTTDKAEIVLVPELTDHEALVFAKALLQGHEKGRALALDHTRILSTIGTNLLFPGLIQGQLQALVSPVPAARYHVSDEQEEEQKIEKANEPKVPPAGKPASGLKTILVMSLAAMLIAAGVTAWLHKDTLLTAIQPADEPAPEETQEEAATTPSEPESESTMADDSPVVMSYTEALPRLTEAAREYTSDRQVELKLIAEATPTEENVEVKEQPVVESPPNPWLTSHDNAYFIAAPADTVVLQLGAVASQAALNRFLGNLGSTQGLKVYHTLKNERSWYVVTTGEYASLAEARRAIPNLASDLQALEPWAKPIAWIHRELAVVMEQ
ncbi:hypothetical protein CWE15_10595 [Aliidiomarina taiwanensis]|uniref:SPOR domain-containing protein n=1 Tax=Aliidiomarina taiwanensis TaxID=946228 RepID=A0A432WW38_9GAMM|nr:AAA family ATPase [Aliidiomarina taiwanensis]RUO37959.1 hypothetical protein CWE15_10595 [Aliidiomarina taiwanensis]